MGRVDVKSFPIREGPQTTSNRNSYINRAEYDYDPERITRSPSFSSSHAGKDFSPRVVGRTAQDEEQQKRLNRMFSNFTDDATGRTVQDEEQQKRLNRMFSNFTDDAAQDSIWIKRKKTLNSLYSTAVPNSPACISEYSSHADESISTTQTDKLLLSKKTKGKIKRDSVQSLSKMGPVLLPPTTVLDDMEKEEKRRQFATGDCLKYCIYIFGLVVIVTGADILYFNTWWMSLILSFKILSGIFGIAAAWRDSWKLSIVFGVLVPLAVVARTIAILTWNHIDKNGYAHYRCIEFNTGTEAHQACIDQIMTGNRTQIIIITSLICEFILSGAVSYCAFRFAYILRTCEREFLDKWENEDDDIYVGKDFVKKDSGAGDIPLEDFHNINDAYSDGRTSVFSII